MLNKFNPNLFAFVCVVIFQIIFNSLAYIKLGKEYLWNDYLYIAVCVWGIILFFISRLAYKKYHSAKAAAFACSNDKEIGKRNWQKEKKQIAIRTVKAISYIFGAATPLYLLAYLDDSDVLQTRLYVPIIFFCIALLSLFLYRYLNKEKYNNDKT